MLYMYLINFKNNVNNIRHQIYLFKFIKVKIEKSFIWQIYKYQNLLVPQIMNNVKDYCNIYLKVKYKNNQFKK